MNTRRRPVLRSCGRKSAAKSAVIRLTEAMAAELREKNINVNCVLPTIIDTPENRKKFISSIPLGRLSTPRDIANAALYLASNEAEFITGVALEVDGGRCV